MQPKGPISPGSEPEKDLLARLDALRTANTSLQREYTSVCVQNAGLQTANAALRETAEVLEQRVDSLRRMLFCPKSERFVLDPDWAQGTLFEGLEAGTPLLRPRLMNR